MTPTQRVNLLLLIEHMERLPRDRVLNMRQVFAYCGTPYHYDDLAYVLFGLRES